MGSSIFSVGAIMGRSFSTLFTQPVVFMGLTILALIPGLIVSLLMRGSTLGNWVAQFVIFVCGMVIQGSISYGVFEVLRGNVALFGKSLSHSIARLGPLLLLGMLWNLGLNVGLTLLIIPGIIVFCIWAVAAPACVVERLGPIESLKRS